jgi:SAM-dependent methyltransferase
MVSFRRISDVLDSPGAYAAWQAPFARSKLMPLKRHNRIADFKNVLEVGCGPGTSAGYFAHANYRGIDLNQRYIEHARRRHRGEFETADARTYIPPADLRFDCIFLNSFLHHIDDENTGRILNRLHDVLAPGGCIHILDLVLPEKRSIARWLATHDRGDYARPLEKWRALFGGIFETVVFEPFAVKALGVDLWQMVYFKGSARR